MRLIDELRAEGPNLIGEAFERATTLWPSVVEQLKNAAKRGGRAVQLSPPDRSPLGRAVCAAVAARLEAEGFRVARIAREPDAMAEALGAASGVVWRVSW